MKFLLTSDTHYGFDKSTHRVHEKFLKKLSEQDFDVLIHAGDIQSDKQHQLPRTLTMFRNAIGDKPFLLVRGNHDFWDAEELTMDGMNLFRSHEEIFSQLNIHHLDTPWEKDYIVVAGFDGWYGSLIPPTNDEFWVPKFNGERCHDYLSKKAHKDLERLNDLDKQGRQLICVTHFPPFELHGTRSEMSANPRYMDVITTKADVLCVGHSHQAADFRHNGCRVLNAGSDYNNPKFIIFEV